MASITSRDGPLVDFHPPKKIKPSTYIPSSEDLLVRERERVILWSVHKPLEKKTIPLGAELG